MFNEKFSHTITCGAAAACFVFNTVCWQAGSELKIYGDSKVSILTSHFHNIILNSSLEDVKEEVLSESYKVLAVCQRR